MRPNDEPNRITRRTFLGQSTGALAASAIPVTADRTEKRKEGELEVEASSKQCKIALEEHGSIWGFTAEASIHTLRLMGSGLFDEFPKLKLILGHLGEGLPCSIWRIDNRITRTLAARPKAKLPMGHYLRKNCFITTSGNFRTPTLTEVIQEVGADRISYSVDYPFEDMGIGGAWFDGASISEADRLKIGRKNAEQLFRL